MHPHGTIRLLAFMDTLRLIPRLMMVAYIYAFWIRQHTWFMALPDPTNAQAAFISTIVGAGAAWFGLYVGKVVHHYLKVKNKWHHWDVLLEA